MFGLVDFLIMSVMCSCVHSYPIFENPYPLTLHESPVTCCEYVADCPADLIPALYSVGSRQKRQGYSKKVCVSILCIVCVLHRTRGSFLVTVI